MKVSFIFEVNENEAELKKEEFKNIFDLYFEDVRRYVFYRSGNETLATDIAQDTFMKIWEKQIQIDSKTVKGLLFKIAIAIRLLTRRTQSRCLDPAPIVHMLFSRSAWSYNRNGCASPCLSP